MDLNNVSSLASMVTPDSLSAISNVSDGLSMAVGNLGAIGGQVGVEVPGLDTAQEWLSYAGAGAKAGMALGKMGVAFGNIADAVGHTYLTKHSGMKGGGGGIAPSSAQQLVQTGIVVAENVALASDALTAAGVSLPMPPQAKAAAVVVGVGGKVLSKGLAATLRVVDNKLARELAEEASLRALRASEEAAVNSLKHQAKSIWSMGDDRARGVFIEKFLANSDYAASKGWTNVGKKHGGFFPLIDFFTDSGVAVSLKTVNTKGGSWRAAMQDHIRELADRAMTIQGNSAVKVLDIRVQPGGASAARSLVEYGKRRGVKVEITEF